MRYCLNPRTPHKQVEPDPPTNADDSSTDAIENKAASQELPVLCRYCKYLLAEAILGDCRILRWIGSGTFGDVYEAEQLPPLRRRVAVKVMALDRMMDTQASEIFAREVGTITSLDHPHIMPVLRIGSISEGHPYLVMKFAAHGSLQKFCCTPLNTPSVGADLSRPGVGQDGRDKSAPTEAYENYTGEILTPRQLLPYVEAAAEALQYAHDHGIVHLDVKPANLLLDSEDRVLLADFGVSALLEDYTHASLRGYVGTPSYTAPEQWLEQPRTASDQYALAVTCYQLLTGHVPFTGNLYTVMRGHIEMPPPPLHEFQPDIAVPVEEVILHALAKDPNARYKDIRTFAQAYCAAVEQSFSIQSIPRALLEIDNTDEEQEAEDERELVLADSSAHLRAQKKAEQDNPPGNTGHHERVTGSFEEQPAHNMPLPLHEPTPSITFPTCEPGRQPGHRSSSTLWRSLSLLMLTLMLLTSSTLGAAYAMQSCLLGACPQMTLNTHTVHMLNNQRESIQISNSGKADLTWKATVQGTSTWLTLSTTHGLLHPGQAATLSLSSKSDALVNGQYVAIIVFSGSNIAPQYVTVLLHVESGLSAVHVSVSGSMLVFRQGEQQLPTQTITIENQSDQTLTWFSMYSEQSWLVITPDEGTLQSGQTAYLAVSVNAQALTPNDYLARVTLMGKLDQANYDTLTGMPLTFEFVLQAAPTLPLS